MDLVTIVSAVVIVVSIVIIKRDKEKFNFLKKLKKLEKQEEWLKEYEQKKRVHQSRKLTNGILSIEDVVLKKRDVVPIWTIQFIQSLDFKLFIKLVAGYFELKGFSIKYSSHSDMSDVFFLYKLNGIIPYPVVKCRAIGADLVSVETVKNFYNLSKQYGLTNIIFVTTGKFSSEVFTLLKNQKGFNLIDVNRFISLLTMLPIEKQMDLFAEVLIDKE